MSDFVKYDPRTGRILYVGDVPESMLGMQGDNILYINANTETDYVDLNTLTLVTKPNKPNEFVIFDYEDKTWKDPRTQDTEWLLVRTKRDTLLAESDWTQLPDVSSSIKELWINYRQLLRDVTLQVDPFNVVWPIKPNN